MTTANNIAEQRKKDALDLALLIYDIFKEEEASVGDTDKDHGDTNASDSNM